MIRKKGKVLNEKLPERAVATENYKATKVLDGTGAHYEDSVINNL